MNQLKHIRKKLGYSQKNVADKLDISVANYSKIERGAIQLTVDRLLQLSSFFALSPEEIIYHHHPSALQNEKRKSNVSYVPVSAQAGLLIDFSNENVEEQSIQFSLPVFYENDLFMINLVGESMYPTFSNGDFILIKKSHSDTDIKWGEPYLVVSQNGQVVKRVHKAKEESKLLLKSDNELYDSYEIELINIKSLWEIKGVLSKNMAPRRL
tara:strand:- start:35 stop:667 length:633 start_codon:yes stop_codon:yes gene_type:complete